MKIIYSVNSLCSFLLNDIYKNDLKMWLQANKQKLCVDNESQ